ncbi:MAG TPA: hypothetical protein VI452_12960 [Marmoricola sp.]
MTRQTLLNRLALAAGVALAANVVLAFVAARHDAVALTLIVFCLVAVLGAVIDGSASLSPARWHVDQLAQEAPLRGEGMLAAHRRMLEDHWAAKQVTPDLQRRLLALAERRVAQAHGLTPGCDREELRDRLGPELQALAEQTPRRMTPAQVARIIDRIEEL